MVLSWTRRNVLRRVRKGKQNQVPDLPVEEIVTPNHFRCPVSLDLMKDPVTLPTGITYDRTSIEKWIEAGNKKCPVTNQILTTFDLIPNHSLRRMIQDWCVKNSSYGIERIPTPRTPLNPFEVSEVCSRLLSASQRGDGIRCVEFVGKIKVWGRDGERNRRCVIENGAGVVLATVFDSFARVSVQNHVGVLEEILEVLTWMIPFGEEGRLKLSSEASVNCMVWFLGGQDLGARKNAARLLKEVPAEILVKTEGIAEGLIEIVKESIGSNSTKACLATIFNLVSHEEGIAVAERFVELGLVSLLLEMIVDCADKGTCEKALGVLDCICDCKEGKEIAKRNALTLPLVIKKLLRVSHLASSFAVSVLRKICDKREEAILIEALQVGAFQKLLVMLQVGCDETTKENATELLKLLNGYKGRAECIDSSLELKYLNKH